MVDQNFDSYAIEYTLQGRDQVLHGRPDRSGLLPRVRQLRPRLQGRRRDLDRPATSPATCRIYDGHNLTTRTSSSGPTRSRRRTRTSSSGTTLVDAIQKQQALQRSRAGRLWRAPVTSLGRMAAHTGQEITLDGLPASATTSSPGDRQADADVGLAADGRPERQVPDPAPGDHQEPRVRVNDHRRQTEFRDRAETGNRFGASLFSGGDGVQHD